MRRLGVLLSNPELSQAALQAATDCDFDAHVLSTTGRVSTDACDLLLTDVADLHRRATIADNDNAPPMLLAVRSEGDLISLSNVFATKLVGLVRMRCLAADLADEVRLLKTAADSKHDSAALSSALVRLDICYALPNDRGAAFAAARALRRDLQVHVGAAPAPSARVAAAVFEAVENAMFHGNLELSSGLRQPAGADVFSALREQRQRQHPYRDRKVWLTARITPQEATVSVRDEGQGFDVSQWGNSGVPDRTQPASPRGRGWLVMQHFCTNVRYNESGNEVTLTVLLTETLPSPVNQLPPIPAPSPLV
jgi:anti-sigma regulatory factor (Ser/Thr protein kinase)